MKKNIFETRIEILLFVLNSRKPVSGIDLQCNASELSTCALNRLLAQFVKLGYLERTKRGNSFLYVASEKTKQIFGATNEKTH